MSSFLFTPDVTLRNEVFKRLLGVQGNQVIVNVMNIIDYLALFYYFLLGIFRPFLLVLFILCELKKPAKEKHTMCFHQLEGVRLVNSVLPAGRRFASGSPKMAQVGEI